MYYIQTFLLIMTNMIFLNTKTVFTADILMDIIYLICTIVYTFMLINCRRLSTTNKLQLKIKVSTTLYHYRHQCRVYRK